MWEFRRIGDYYELLDGAETLYLCKRLDSIMVATLEDLCNRHNAEMAKYENLDVEIVSCDEAYLNGLEDGKEEAAQERYDVGYEDGYTAAKDNYNKGYANGYNKGYTDGWDNGYRCGLMDAIACEDKLT